MTLSEFKAWLEGYRHSFEGGYDGRPTKEQWDEIKARMEQIALIKPVVPTPHYVPSIKDVMPTPAKVWYGAGDDPKMMGGAR